MFIGAAFFFLGAATLLGLLFANGGLQKSRQFAVLGQLFSAQLGAGKRVLSFVAIGLTVIGGVLCMAGVALKDAARAERCRQYCLTAGFVEGKIGPSVDRAAKSRFVACTCSAPDKPALERRADSL